MKEAAVKGQCVAQLTFTIPELLGLLTGELAVEVPDSATLFKHWKGEAGAFDRKLSNSQEEELSHLFTQRQESGKFTEDELRTWKLGWIERNGEILALCIESPTLPFVEEGGMMGALKLSFTKKESNNGSSSNQWDSKGSINSTRISTTGQGGH
jgi:hypothetical protein